MLESICGYSGRILVCSLTAGGCVCAYYAATSCEFFSYVSQRPEELPDPFTNQTEAFVGLFHYYENFQDQGCKAYDNVFIDAAQADVSPYLVTAQFSAVAGPSAGAMVWLLNILEWLLLQNTCTHSLTITMLVLAFLFQGMTFFIYAQREFCFDDQISEDCSLELGAIMSISAALAFYAATVVWCCMPRTAEPVCFAKDNSAEEDMGGEDYYKYANKSQQQEGHQSNADPPNEWEPNNSSGRPLGAATAAGEAHAWADSDNRDDVSQPPGGSWEDEVSPNFSQSEQQEVQPGWDGKPAAISEHQQQQQQQQQQHQETMQHQPTSAYQEHQQPYSNMHSSDPPGYQDHTSTWTSHENGAETMATDTFENPFLEPSDAVSNYTRPAYGNLQ